MTPYRRDALLAAVVLGVLLAVLVVEGALGTLLHPLAAVVGIGTALLVEAVFLRFAGVEQLWTRPLVQVGSALVVAAVGLGALAVAGPAAVAALCWGLATYFVLLGALLATGRNPLAAVP